MESFKELLPLLPAGVDEETPSSSCQAAQAAVSVPHCSKLHLPVNLKYRYRPPGDLKSRSQCPSILNS